MLGKSLNPKFCPNCGIPYTAEKVPSTDHEVQEPRHIRYTKQQLGEFKHEFARQRRRQIAVGTAAIVIVIGAGVAGEMEIGIGIGIGIPGGILLFTFIFTILGSLLFVFANWRCPACKNHFGFGGSVNQGYCPKCGVLLKEK